MIQRANQLLLFDMLDDHEAVKITDGKKYDTTGIELSQATINRLSSYRLEDYIKDVETHGLEDTWNKICQFALDQNGSLPSFLDIKNFGELYEIGLAIQDKILKKKSGQYYTPDDVASVMSEWLEKSKGTAVCDVACGTGKLILTYLDLIGFEKARELISSGNLYLFDFDNVALKICRTTIAVKYGLDIAESINDVYCDFLDKEISLPEHCKVISNPPYAHIDNIQIYWEQSEVLLNTRELYSAFMEKIFRQAESAVVITPFSFISGTKFYSLREEMCRLGNGFVVSFDNVPGNIFCGRKHGIFNTNTANSVRAAITVFEHSDEHFGFRVSPLIRFKNEERAELLTCSVLEKTLPDTYQIVNRTNTMFGKVDKRLSDIFDVWLRKSAFTTGDFISYRTSAHVIDMPNTCRYFTTASARKLNRTGSITLNIQGEDQYHFLYCMINSSFAYWWWRIYDGGITYPIKLLNNMPVPFNLLNDIDKDFFNNMAKRLMEEEDSFIVTKLNAGTHQENIKFPEKYRIEINKRILSILGFTYSGDIFNPIHINHFTGSL